MHLLKEVAVFALGTVVGLYAYKLLKPTATGL